ncbi:MAG: tRNA preQ1(34) S-adenosylmethionine ribosyltransferase-isomerase QueA [Clostridia bacterium]|nr:MAG: tRNA preQ1(34) S-adenosylmethionine ribosyltransferase-isomerase QueA [Clostridia bacterium]
MKVSYFDYELPEELIAQEPVYPRDAARLLVVHRETDRMEFRQFQEIVDYLRPGDVLVLNETRVMPARLRGEKESSGGKVEVLLLHPIGPDLWEVLVRPGRRVQAGASLIFAGGRLRASVVEVKPGGRRVLAFTSPEAVAAVIEEIGLVPLPPYIKKPLADSGRYQTVYARIPGSAAAPTAGLHFTPELLARVREAGVAVARVLLHIGLGTFRPVRVENVEEHQMHAEYFQIGAEACEVINRCREGGGRIVAVGTTAVRVLETAADQDGRVRPQEGWADLFIYPGYQFRAVEALVTNFHLPRSTLLMLVCAFAGQERVLRAYQEAVSRRFRFYSFGDAMLII